MRKKKKKKYWAGAIKKNVHIGVFAYKMEFDIPLSLPQGLVIWFNMAVLDVFLSP